MNRNQYRLHRLSTLVMTALLLEGSTQAQQNTQIVRPVPVQLQQLQPSMTFRQAVNLTPAQLTQALKTYNIAFQGLNRPVLIRVPAKPTITPVGGATTSTQNTPDGQMLCSTQRYNLKSAPPEYAMKTLDQDKLWVGAFVKTQGLELGSMQSVNIPETRRKPYRVTSALPTASASATIQPNQTAYNLAAAAVRNGQVGTPFGSTIRYEITEQSSADTSALKLGMKATGIGYSVAAAGSYTSQNKQSRVSAIFVQNAFTLNADIGGQSATDGFLKDPTQADLDALSGNKAAYVDSITYGRLLFVEMTSSYTSDEMKAALEGSYMGVSASTSAQQKKVLEQSRFNIYAAGGNEQAIMNLIRTQKLGDYFQTPADPRTLVPISFTARNFNSGSYAASASTGEYAETVCNPNSIKVQLRISVKLNRPDDGNDANDYDNFYGNIDLDGDTVWSKTKNEKFDFYKNETKTLYKSSSPLTLNYGEARSMNLNARFMDWDSVSADDVISIYNKKIDLQAVADDFKATGRAVYRIEYSGKGSDGARSTLIIEFVRN